MKKQMLPGILTLALFICLNNSFAQQGSSGATQSRALSNFSFIDLQMSGTVYVKQADKFSVTVDAPADIIDKITTEVASNTLIIKSKLKTIMGNTPPVKIYVSLPKPNGLEVNGSGDIVAQTTITTNFLLVNITGSGTIKLMEVAAGKLNLELNGSGQIEHSKVTAESSLIEIRGSGGYSGESMTSRLISISLDGSGSVKLSDVAAGKLWIQNSGSGSVRQLSGMATEVLFENNGSGSIAAGGLNSGTISVSNTGSGNIEVGKSETLNAELSGSGSIHYHGTPKTMRKDVSGSGRLSQN